MKQNDEFNSVLNTEWESLGVKIGRYELALNRPIDISRPVAFFQGHPSIFGIGRPSCRRLYSIDENTGLGCNCFEITFCPHSHGTHIESSAHVMKEASSVLNLITKIPPLVIACLINVKASSSSSSVEDSGRIEEEVLKQAVAPFQRINHRVLIINTKNDVNQTKFTCLAPSAINYLVDAFPLLEILLIDSPSIDPEHDDGRLTAHRLLFAAKKEFLIIELCRIPQDINPGIYGLALNVANFDQLDAIPCRPVLYPLKNLDGKEM